MTQHIVTVQFPQGAYPGPDFKHGVVTSSNHPRIHDGTVVEYHRDRAEDGLDVLRVSNEEYRIDLTDGYMVDHGGQGTAMRCVVQDDQPWRVTND